MREVKMQLDKHLKDIDSELSSLFKLIDELDMWDLPRIAPGDLVEKVESTVSTLRELIVITSKL